LENLVNTLSILRIFKEAYKLYNLRHSQTTERLRDPSSETEHSNNKADDNFSDNQR